MMQHTPKWLVVLAALIFSSLAQAETLLTGFEKATFKTDSKTVEEQVRWTRLESGVRVLVDAPVTLEDKPRVLIVYATPNGNSLEQTLGCKRAEGLDFRYDIQHVAAQVRRLREIDPASTVILAVVQAPKLSWPAFRSAQPDAGRIIWELVDRLSKEFDATKVILSCHSGGGSFIFGYMNEVDALPESIERIVFLDANYSYSDADRHGDKLLKWLDGDTDRHLVVVAYDDREILYNGKKVVGPTGGTFRATERMLARFRKDRELTEQPRDPFRYIASKNGQLQFWVHPNSDNKILHTALVGEMNGLLHALTLGTNQEKNWGHFGGPRAYAKWVQQKPFTEPAPTRPDVPAETLRLPPRPDDAPTGSEFCKQIGSLPIKEREKAIAAEVLRGNVPDFLRRLVPVRVRSTDAQERTHQGICYVMPDYLAVGTDDDFFRVPLSPRTATLITDAIGCSLPTTKLSDDLFAVAEVRLAPRPLTKDRESIDTFLEHHRLIEKQLHGKARGLLVVGIKKDVVLSNRLLERPHKVAIYGWHYPSGKPIQPLYTGHYDLYVDYSHGVRFVSDRMLIDGHPHIFSMVLKDQVLCGLLSSEGPIDIEKVRKASQW